MGAFSQRSHRDRSQVPHVFARSVVPETVADLSLEQMLLGCDPPRQFGEAIIDRPVGVEAIDGC